MAVDLTNYQEIDDFIGNCEDAVKKYNKWQTGKKKKEKTFLPFTFVNYCYDAVEYWESITTKATQNRDNEDIFDDYGQIKLKYDDEFKHMCNEIEAIGKKKYAKLSEKPSKEYSGSREEYENKKEKWKLEKEYYDARKDVIDDAEGTKVPSYL